MLQSLMVIDDDEVDQYIAKRTLKKLGFTGKLFQQNDGLSAIEFLSNFSNNKESWPEEFPPSLILLDINMPRMNGFEFLEAFKELRTGCDSLNALVIMMFSSSERPEDIERALKFDFVRDYMTKPLTKENLKTIFEATP